MPAVVLAFAINREDGSLKHLNTQPSMGANPTAVIIDKTNSRVWWRITEQWRKSPRSPRRTEFLHRESDR